MSARPTPLFSPLKKMVQLMNLFTDNFVLIENYNTHAVDPLMKNVKQNKINSSASGSSSERMDFEQIIQNFRQQLTSVCSHGPEIAISKHRERGKLLARERIDLLIDPQTPFVELSPFAAYGQYNNDFPSAGIVTGIGEIHGHKCIIVANDATVKGGTYIKETIKKHIRAQEIALKNQLPCIYLVDSGGIFLPEQSRVFPDRFDFGRIFFNQARLSAAGIPQIAIVMGSCTAGGAYVPAMCDETVIVRNQGTIFIGGPPLVKAATGEEVTAEELGGGNVHTQISGVADHLADNDEHALLIARNIVGTLPKRQKQPSTLSAPTEPEYPAEHIYNYLSADLKKPVDIHAIVAHLADKLSFHEFKANYGKTLLTGFARIKGIPVGILGNQSFLTAESARKGAHFIQLCNQRQIPLLFLQNITGFIVGKKYEHEGIARDGAKLINAVANSTVPKITVIIGGSFGAGNYAMSGRAYDPDFLFMWPHSRIAVMGGEQASGVLQTISGNTQSNSLIDQIEHESTAYYSSSRLWDDGIIDPADTRDILGLILEITHNQHFTQPQYGIFRM